MRISSYHRAHYRVGAGLGIACLLLVGGCGSGFDAETHRPYSPTSGGQADVGDIQARGLLIMQEGSEFYLQGGLVNSGMEEDQLVKVEVADATATLAGPVKIAPGALTLLTSKEGAAEASVGKDMKANVPITGSLTLGDVTSVTLTFEKAGTIANQSILITDLESVESGA